MHTPALNLKSRSLFLWKVWHLSLALHYVLSKAGPGLGDCRATRAFPQGSCCFLLLLSCNFSTGRRDAEAQQDLTGRTKPPCGAMGGWAGWQRAVWNLNFSSHAGIFRQNSFVPEENTASFFCERNPSFFFLSHMDACSLPRTGCKTRQIRPVFFTEVRLTPTRERARMEGRHWNFL